MPAPLDFIPVADEKFVDFGHRGTHEMTVAAKAIIAAYHGRNTSRSLFASCSTGGRQALMEAYRYPEDYDGISSMAPANPMIALMVSSLWTGSATARDPASHISPAQFAVVHEAAVKSCDADDGVVDGMLSYFRDLVFTNPKWDFRTFDLYQKLTTHLDAHRAQNARLFMIPGMGHCGAATGLSRSMSSARSIGGSRPGARRSASS